MSFASTIVADVAVLTKYILVFNILNPETSANAAQDTINLW